MDRKILLVALAFMLLSGCVSTNRTFTNQSGQQYHCNNKGYGIIGSIVASNNASECEKQANAKGYK